MTVRILPVALIVALCACNASQAGEPDLGVPVAPTEQLLELSGAAFTGATIDADPIRATPSTPAELSAVAMTMALPLRVGDRLTALDLSCVAPMQSASIGVKILRTHAQGVDATDVDLLLRPQPVWARFTIQDSASQLASDETLSLRIVTAGQSLAPIACGNVTVHYVPGA